VVVYLQGLPTPTTVDPRGLLPGWQREPGEEGDRDLKFVDTVLASMRQRYAVDDDRVYATGFSNGGMFTYLLWAQRGKTFAGFAVCAALLFPDVNPTLPRALLHIAGKADPLVPFNQQVATVERARKIDAATDPGRPCGFGCTKYLSLTSTPVMKVVHPGGHVYIPAAPRLTVEFFKGVTRR
jgi:polyhydroxybutyrate depolymerase